MLPVVDCAWLYVKCVSCIIYSSEKYCKQSPFYSSLCPRVWASWGQQRFGSVLMRMSQHLAEGLAHRRCPILTDCQREEEVQSYRWLGPCLALRKLKARVRELAAWPQAWNRPSGTGSQVCGLCLLWGGGTLVLPMGLAPALWLPRCVTGKGPDEFGIMWLQQGEG